MGAAYRLLEWYSGDPDRLPKRGDEMNIKRAKRDRWILGVCGGVAHTYGWSSGAVRLATAVLAIIIPGPSLVATLLVYLLLGAILPESEEY
jgi:phage shock protein PspC (stress-responsive transcriptional regulator)